MKIAIIGASAIGGYVGLKLALSGEDVTFIVRGANRGAIRKNGMLADVRAEIWLKLWGNLTFNPICSPSCSPEESPSNDLFSLETRQSHETPAVDTFQTVAAAQIGERGWTPSCAIGVGPHPVRIWGKDGLPPDHLGRTVLVAPQS